MLAACQWVLHLIRLQSSVHIEVVSVCGQGRKVETCKYKIVKFIQEPGEFVLQHSKDRVIAQLASVPERDYSVIKGIIPPVLATAAHQSVFNDNNNMI
jgi:hypothetical protein